MSKETVQFIEMVREAVAALVTNVRDTSRSMWCDVCHTDTTHVFDHAGGGWEYWKCIHCNIIRMVKTS